MKTTVFYGLERMTIKRARAIKGFDRLLANTKTMARDAAALDDNGHAEVSTICETNKGTALTIRVKI